MNLTRFEKKILGAIAAVAIVPLVAALVLGRAALREAYEVGVNPRVGEQLEEGLEVYRAHFVALRDDAERTADAVAKDWSLTEAVRAGDPRAVDEQLAADLERYPNVARVVVRDAGGEVIGEAQRDERMDESVMRHLTQTRELPTGDGQVEVTAGLRVGEEIALAGVEALEAGQQVRRFNGFGK